MNAHQVLQWLQAQEAASEANAKIQLNRGIRLRYDYWMDHASLIGKLKRQFADLFAEELTHGKT